MRLALAQINSFLGDFSSNASKILDYCHQARARRCDIVVFPEAALFGYHPVDLLERPSIVDEQIKALKALHKKIPSGLLVILGAITKNTSLKGKPYYNSAVALERGRAMKIFPKTLLPTYDVFDEARFIERGDVKKNVLRFRGRKILLTICEDIWAWPGVFKGTSFTYGKNPLLAVKAGRLDLVLNLSASPFTKTKLAQRLKVTKKTAQHFKAPLAYCNLVGAQDELIFDGASFAISSKGKILAQCSRHQEDLAVVDLQSNEGMIQTLPRDDRETLRQALALGIRDFVTKTGFKRVHLGLSGGIDSALVACLAADALGPRQVQTFILPTHFNSKESESLASELAANLDLPEPIKIPMEDLFNKASQALAAPLSINKFSVLHENLQARLRGLVLMAYSNHAQSLLLNTSNKSEFAVGYSTLYGDLCGGLCPIGDLLKTEVYRLAQYYNHQHEVIPDEILSRPPSAELRDNQTDQDTLPPYNRLDKAIESIVTQFRAPRNSTESEVLKWLMGSEFKRWQAPPILKISDHAFGRGRRFPLAHRAIF